MKYDMLVEGGQIPSGKVKVSGAKNSATRLLAASLLTDEPVRIRNFPTQLVDVVEKIGFIRKLGARVEVDDEREFLEILTPGLSCKTIDDWELPIRTTYLLTAGQIVRNGIARIPYPGGCKIGARGYDLHMMVWKALGCEVREEESYIQVNGSFRGGSVDFPISTVGGTENALMCASVATGTTEIRNAYITPEVEDLIDMLQQMGAGIENFGNSLIRVRGMGGLMRGASFEVMPDRIEALTWIVFAAMTGGDVYIKGVPFRHMKVPLLHLEEAGLDLYRNSHSVFVSGESIQGQGIQPFELACGTHPGVISDMQSFYVLLGMKANGISRTFDYRYPERIAYARELSRFNADAIACEPGKITTFGIASLKGADVTSTDLRGSMALVMAAFCADGQSRIKDVHMAMRGYNGLLDKLKTLGVHASLIETG
ncbi:UDP-N-acetylglucosamine 1-carboxyvinyltransferase [Marinobacter daqiaonensis]|uniref:UDP-N-acetylglucosamine 1-carboxyvinyltransferase n=1 Tax=Marinobacter daqiaonensis TaxID=650891 RepID=A0A1I6I4X8_9GAMM|nr:UDP-N-acetylglucosamine 1-carboxyvinyltransferase [Marinobacter daqiaonensis]SFR61719.1 UDP-N-acetylglucosamine 1-carboxyvinyltransferase [Marinobacter daqiaonensis]